MQVTTQVTPVTNTSNVTANIAIDHSQVDLWQADPAVWRKPEQIAYLRDHKLRTATNYKLSTNLGQPQITS